MRSHRIVLCSVAALAVTCGLAISGSVPASSAAPPAMLAEWTWYGTGGSTIPNWNWDCNWTDSLCPGNGPYPDDTGDNATFPTNGGTAWPVDLTTETIGDLTVEESVDFGAVSGSPTLDVQLLYIDADAGDITITMDSDASIVVTPDP